MSGVAQGLRAGRWFRWCVELALVLPVIGWAQSTDPEGEFVYHARPHDTLIGLGRRLLKDPRRWPEVQSRNNIADPRHIPLGDPIRIPYSWLRLGSDTATVIAVSGDVRGGGQSVSVAQALPEGSRLQTGGDGSVTMLLADGSVVTVHKLSVLALEQMRRVTGVEDAHVTQFKLESGRLQTHVKAHGDVGRFEIHTPVAVSAVRGTEFRDAFEPAGGSATTETLEGLVEVSGSGAAVAVPADFGTRVEQGAPPRPPIRLLPAPDLQSIAATNSSTRLHLSWTAVPGASHYRLQLASDSEFHAFLQDAELTDPEVDLPSPADGTYWLRVRAIDEIGLEGHDAVRSFLQHQLPAAPSVVGPLTGANIIGESTIFSWNEPGAGVHYRVQVAKDADFNQMFFERDTGEVTHVNLDHVPSGQYFWRVSATDDRGQSGDWSTVQKYTQRRASPIPHLPEFTRHEMQLRWDPQEGMRYRVQIARNPQFNAPLVDQTVESPNLTTRRYYLGTYYARIQTIAEDGSVAPFGQPLRFEVPVPLWLKILLPLLPLLQFV